MKSSRIALLATFGLACAQPSPAIVVWSGDNAANLAPPPDGAPWQHVVRVGDPDGSGVYLGNRFILTANHLPHQETTLINGQSYALDPSFAVKRINREDLKMYRVLGDPGLPGVTLLGAKENEFARRCTVIGWGLGRGTAVYGRGWRWNGLRVQRWGTNITLPYLLIDDALPRLATAFNRGAGVNEMSLANTDSGCGLFVSVGGTWKLAGIGVGVDDNAAYYDRDGAKAGFQPTRSYYVRIRPHLTAIRAILDTAAP